MCRSILFKFHVNSHDALEIYNREHIDVIASSCRKSCRAVLWCDITVKYGCQFRVYKKVRKKLSDVEKVVLSLYLTSWYDDIETGETKGEN